MSKISVVFWSQSGNTQAMAEAIAKGITEAGKEAESVYVGDVSVEDLKKEKSIQPSFKEITFKIKQEEEKVKLANNAAKEILNNGGILKADNNSSSLNFSSSNAKLSKKDDAKKYTLKLDNTEDIDVSIPIDLKSSHNYTYDAEKDTKLENEMNSNYNSKNSYMDKTSDTYISEDSSDNIEDSSQVSPNNIELEAYNNLTDNKIRKERKYDEKPIAKFPPITIIGQYNKTYILGEYAGTLYMIDQHAAHEKIYFEKYLKDIECGDIVVQPLMIPCVIDLTCDDYSYFEENKEIFKEAGFILEEFGGTSVALKEVPYFLGKLNPKKLFIDILDNLKNLGNGKTTEVKHNAIATKACKSAIKGNDELQMNEMIKLVDDLRYIDDPFHCPHGRPVIIKFTSTDIDKKFKRIV